MCGLLLKPVQYLMLPSINPLTPRRKKFYEHLLKSELEGEHALPYFNVQLNFSIILKSKGLQTEELVV